MTTVKRRIFWDSCVFIRLLSVTKDPAKLAEREICKFCLQDAIDLKTEIVVSTTSFAEVVKTEDLISPPVPEDTKEKIRLLFDEPYIIPISADLIVARAARELIWRHSWLKPIDAIVIASATYAKVDELFSYDGLGEKKGILDLDGQIGNPPMKIVKPHFEGQKSFLLPA